MFCLDYVHISQLIVLCRFTLTGNVKQIAPTAATVNRSATVFVKCRLQMVVSQLNTNASSIQTASVRRQTLRRVYTVQHIRQIRCTVCTCVPFGS